MANETSEDHIHKYTINIPRSLWSQVKLKTAWGTRYNNRVSPYILRLIERDCRECPNPPKRYHGFQFKLGNPFYLRNFLEKQLTFGKQSAIMSRNSEEAL